MSNQTELDRLINLSSDWERHWKAARMPEYNQADLNSELDVIVHFKNIHDRLLYLEVLSRMGYKPCTNTTYSMKWMWFPPQQYQKWTDKNAPPQRVNTNKYPIYIISKGRWESRLTVRQLVHLGIDFFIVVEPSEYAQYAAVIDPKCILQLPSKDAGTGCSIPARNFVWKHAEANGHKKHWILDDNIQGFFEFNHNMKPKIRDYNPFEIVERFVEHHNNVGLAGMNYEFFVQRRNEIPPYYLNTRIYSCILIRHDLPLGKDKWRGTYNEDTDLSLRVLKLGFSTVLFNYVLAKKVTTGILPGGNDAIYKLAKGDGRLEMAKALCLQHPDVSKITWKYKRWQHQVNYRGFARNPLDR